MSPLNGTSDASRQIVEAACRPPVRRSQPRILQWPARLSWRLLSRQSFAQVVQKSEANLAQYSFVSPDVMVGEKFGLADNLTLIDGIDKTGGALFMTCEEAVRLRLTT